MFFKYTKDLLQSKTQWLNATLCFTLAFFAIAIISQQLRFSISETDSLPYHYFLNIPKIKPKKYDYTLVESPWYQGKIIKRIIGVAGDHVWLHSDGQIYVNQFKVGFPYPSASDGRSLKAIKAQIIPKEYVFLYSDHPKSFDSRYKELGLIPLSSLQGLVIPLG